MAISFTRKLAREQSGAGVRAGGSKAQSTWQYYLSSGNREMFKMVWPVEVCSVEIRDEGRFCF